MLTTEREDIKPVLGMDWLRDLNRTIRHIEKTTTTTDQTEKDKIIRNFEKLWETNQTIKDSDIKEQPEPGHPLIKQKARPIRYHLESYVRKK